MRSDIESVTPEELMAYLDGELSADRAAFVDGHLEECRECQILAAEFKSIAEHLTIWEIETNDPVIPADLAKALDGCERESTSGGRWNPFRSGHLRTLAPWAGGALVGGVVTFLLVFTLIFSIGRGENQRPPLTAQMATTPPPAAGPAASVPGGDRDHLLAYSMAQLTANETEASKQRMQESQLASNLKMSRAIPTSTVQPPSAPMILRTAQITVVTQNLDQARTAMDAIVQHHSGYVGDLTVSAPADGARKLTANLRIPAAQLDTAMAELKKLGRVESESQSGQDVTAQYVDLEARLSNSRNTEERLLELLSQRTGKLSDVLEVETELSRVREEIERMEGERRLLSKQVEYATLSTTLTEEYKAPARALPDSLGTRFRNAAVDGYQSVLNFVIGVALFLVSDGPMLLLWIGVLFFPARYGWRKFRSRYDPQK